MEKVFKFMVSLVAVICVLALVMVAPNIYNQITTIKKIENTMIKYAQKNGGFMPVVDEFGNVIAEPMTVLNDMLTTYGLNGRVKDIKFFPGINIPVQKRDRFKISITPIISIKIPGGGYLTFDSLPIPLSGYSHKYFK